MDQRVESSSSMEDGRHGFEFAPSDQGISSPG